MRTLTALLVMAFFAGAAFARENPDGRVGQKWIETGGFVGVDGTWKGHRTGGDYALHSLDFGMGFVASNRLTLSFGLISSQSEARGGEYRYGYGVSNRSIGIQLRMRIYL